MKTISKYYRWIILAVIVNVLLLSFLEYGYLSNNGSFVVESGQQEESNPEIKNISIQLPDGAEDIKVSYDNLYISFLENNKLIIKEFESGKDVKSLPNFEGELNYYKWLADRDIIIYGIKIPNNGVSNFKVLLYDVENERTMDNFPEIHGLPEVSTIKNIQSSAIINCTYVKIKTSDTRCRIYKYNIMNYLTRVMTTNAETDIMGLFNINKVFYTDSEKKIQLLNGDTGATESFANKYRYELIAVDSLDIAYFGILDESGNIKEILAGNLKDFENHEFSQYPLLPSIKVGDIFVTDIGNIYTYNRFDKITDIKSKEETQINGRPLFVRDEGIITRFDNKIEMLKFN
jgi:hypothetical protein